MAFQTKLECPGAVAQSLGRILFSEEFADITVVVEGSQERIPAHKQILAASSEVFKSMLYGPFVEGTTNEVVLSGVDTSTLKNLLSFMYTGSLELDLYTLVPLIEAAERYCVVSAIEELYKVADQLLNAAAVNAEVLEQTGFIMATSYNRGIDRVLEMCLEYFDIHIKDLVESEVFLKMPIELLQLIFGRDTLDDGFFEVRLYLACLRWARQGGGTDEKDRRNFEITEIPEDKLEDLKKLLKLIRFPQIHAQFIVENIEPTQLISKDELYLALAYQTAPQCCSSEENPSFRERVGSRRPWVWSEEKIGPHIVLSYDKKTAIAHHYDWEKVMGKAMWYAGVHVFSVILEMNIAATSNSWQIIVGLAGAQSAFNGHLGSDRNEWGLACYSGQKISDRDQREDFATPSKRGDKITARVDLKARTLEFLRNGVSLGVAYTDVRPPVIPAVSLLKGQRVTLVFDED